MPLEGHYSRVNTPLRELTVRERSVAFAVVAITSISILVLILVTATDTLPGPGPGCVQVTVAGRTGGEVISTCGAKAIALCKSAMGPEGPWAEAVSRACSDRSIKF